MSIRRVAAVVLVVSVVTGPGARAQAVGPHVKTARVTFTEPTFVAGHLLVGEYIIAHDEDRMHAGQPCTTIYLPTPREAKRIVSFVCLPRPRPAADHAILRVAPDPNRPYPRLIEYQLPGEAEGHGVR